jgi:hypothetical protein
MHTYTLAHELAWLMLGMLSYFPALLVLNMYGLANHLWSLAIVVRGCDYSWETNRLVWSNGEGTIDRGHEPMNALGNCPC